MDPRTLYTKHADAYVSFNSLFRSAQAYRAFFRSYERLRSDLRILDAGCGTGIPTLALVRALADRGLAHRRIDALDLTPAMLARFRESVSNLGIANVRVQEADVPAFFWHNYWAHVVEAGSPAAAHAFPSA